jgi:hypothetical protein
LKKVDTIDWSTCGKELKKNVVIQIYNFLPVKIRLTKASLLSKRFRKGFLEVSKVAKILSFKGTLENRNDLAFSKKLRMEDFGYVFKFANIINFGALSTIDNGCLNSVDILISKINYHNQSHIEQQNYINE